MISPRFQKNNVVLFADDTNRDSEFLEENYDLDLNNIETWMTAKKKLTMNQDKIETFVISLKKLKPLIKFGGNVLKAENDVRYLEVQIDCNFSFTEHI